MDLMHLSTMDLIGRPEVDLLDLPAVVLTELCHDGSTHCGSRVLGSGMSHCVVPPLICLPWVCPLGVLWFKPMQISSTVMPWISWL